MHYQNRQQARVRCPLLQVWFIICRATRQAQPQDKHSHKEGGATRKAEPQGKAGTATRQGRHGHKAGTATAKAGGATRQGGPQACMQAAAIYFTSIQLETGVVLGMCK
jgi:hypothetical protein